MGPVPGLSNLRKALDKVREVDAVVLTLGEIKRVYPKLRGHDAPAVIVRSDWTNLLRDENHILPAVDVRHVTVADAEDVALSGAVAATAFFLVGYNRDEEEARNMEEVAKLARGCARLSIPLLVQAMPFGSRVTEDNLYDCIRMAARMSLEVGADLLAAPYPGSSRFLKDLVESVRVPLFLWDRGLQEKNLENRCKEALDSGAAGLMLGEGVFSREGWPETVKRLQKLIHR